MPISKQINNDEIELIIKIPQNEYDRVIDGNGLNYSCLNQAILDSTPLPKDHGRIADIDNIRDLMLFAMNTGKSVDEDRFKGLETASAWLDNLDANKDWVYGNKVESEYESPDKEDFLSNYLTEHNLPSNTDMDEKDIER